MVLRVLSASPASDEVTETLGPQQRPWAKTGLWASGHHVGESGPPLLSSSHQAPRLSGSGGPWRAVTSSSLPRPEGVGSEERCGDTGRTPMSRHQRKPPHPTEEDASVNEDRQAPAVTLPRPDVSTV